MTGQHTFEPTRAPFMFILGYPWDGAPHHRPHASTFLFEAVSHEAPCVGVNVLSYEFFRRFPTAIRHFLKSRIDLPTGVRLRNLLVRPGPSASGHAAALGRVLARNAPLVAVDASAPPWIVWPDPAYADVLDYLPQYRHVYYCTDDFVAARGNRAAEVEFQENTMGTRCSAIVAVSERLCRRLGRVAANVILLPNGVDPRECLEDVPPHALLADIKPPRAVYVGHLNGRVDVPLLIDLVKSGFEGSLLLVGPRDDGDRQWDRLLALPRVHAVGPRDRREVRAILAGASVGLIPYRLTPFNLACCPLKVHEYLGAGLPVVSTDLPGVRNVHPSVRVTESGLEFVESTRAAAQRPRLPMRARMQEVNRNSWTERARHLLSCLPSSGVSTPLREAT